MKRHSLLFCAAILLAGLPRMSADTVKEPAEIVRTVAPEYPDEQHRAGLSGIVTVKCTIDEHGNVIAAEVVKSTDKAAVCD